MIYSINFLSRPWLIVLAGLVSFLGGPAYGQTASQDNFKAHYVLGTGDQISIQVFDEPDLTMDALVSDSGSINYSYVGTIEVAGKTPQQIEQRITDVLKDGYLVNPSVNVSIRQYRPFFINGEVRSPGGYPYQPGLTVDRAIALAGGLTDRASKRKIFLVRGGSANGRRNKVGLSKQIEPGDIITINEGFF